MNRPTAERDPVIRSRTVLRIAHISLGTNVGGLEKLLVEFAKHSDRSRFVPHFVSLQEKGRLSSEIESHDAPLVSLNKPTGFRPAYVLKLARRLRTWKIDVVHTHNMAAALYGVPAAKLAGVRAVVHTRHGQRLARRGRERVSFQMLSHLIDRIVSVSENSHELAVASGTPASKAAVVHNGIDLDRFSFSGGDPKGPAVAVTRLDRGKDLESLIRAVAIIKTDHPGFRLKIAGDGACRPGLEQLVRDLGLEQSVMFLGNVTNVPELLSTASLYILPSLHEGVPLSLLEAMARGIPAIASSVGGIPEVLIDENCGLLVPPKSPEAMAGAIQRVLADAELASRLSAGGRKRVEDAFDVRRMVLEYELLYAELVSRPGWRKDRPYVA